MTVTLLVSEIMFAYFPSGEKYAYEVVNTHDNYATRGAQGHTGGCLNLWGLRWHTGVTYGPKNMHGKKIFRSHVCNYGHSSDVHGKTSPLCNIFIYL